MKTHKCPVCGKFEFPRIGSYDICDVCGWCDDDYQEEFPDEDRLANQLSLNQARTAYKNGWYEVLREVVDFPEDGETPKVDFNEIDRYAEWSRKDMLDEDEEYETDD